MQQKLKQLLGTSSHKKSIQKIPYNNFYICLRFTENSGTSNVSCKSDNASTHIHEVWKNYEQKQ